MKISRRNFGKLATALVLSPKELYENLDEILKNPGEIEQNSQIQKNYEEQMMDELRQTLKPLPSKPKIKLTIDDGPTHYQPEIIEKLGENNQVIFYICGSYVDNKGFEQLKETIKKGHIIGNHSFTHPNFKEISFSTAKSQILKTDEIINQAYKEAGVERKDKFFRFPYGNLTSSAVSFLKEIGYKPAGSWERSWTDWDVDTEDWRYYSKKAPKSLNSIMNNCKQTKEGYVVLCHEKGITTNNLIPYFVEKFTSRITI